ncbi:hypothetical protein Ahy_B07g087087 [Arachis hypogaea]|uniref:Myb/SANT-like DNA-binding domain-containing protein n=1 Tax=Arachis hypogaea TaxID=3818 RepID=A0A444YB72_ARAHY|nr:hypothetical protein Ahy_B07g087087 [Arachis hypogaea]
MRGEHDNLMMFFVLTLFVYFKDSSSGQVSLGGRMNNKIRRDALERIIGKGDRNYIWELRMNTNAFANLMTSRGWSSKLVEASCNFFNYLSASQKKIVVYKLDFVGSEKQLAVIRIQSILFAKASPVEEDCVDPTRRRFKVMMDKRIWRDEETEAFVGFMEEFVVDGQKADYRQLKPETFEKLALKMLEAFPNYTLTTKHCKNKHKRLKEKY